MQQPTSAGLSAPQPANPPTEQWLQEVKQQLQELHASGKGEAHVEEDKLLDGQLAAAASTSLEATST